MPSIYQYGDLNTTSLTVPDLYVQIQQPATLSIAGVSTSRIGIVGTASWGPVNAPQVIGGLSGYLTTFGVKQNSATDAGVAVNIAQLQGASDFRVVRVTDGTDTAATTNAGGPDGNTYTARYTGSSGNGISLAFSAAASGTGGTLLVTHPVLTGASYSGATWQDIADQANNDASGLITIQPGAGVAYDSFALVLKGGSDGSTPSAAQFVGKDVTSARTGMYALRGQACAIGILHGISDSTTWTAQASFGLGEGVYMIATGPAGDTIANAIATKSTAGLTSYGVSLMFGDWIYYSDDTNGTMLTSPQAWKAGRLASLSPQLPALNRQLYGITGSQKAGLASSSSKTYSSAELSALFEADIDVICNPAPGGSYWAVRGGINSSATVANGGDEYTRLTNYLANSFRASLGEFVGDAINSDLFQDVRASILEFLSGLASQSILDGSTTSLPYAVVCDVSNNPQARTALGYLQVDIQVRYQGIVRYFICNLQGGSDVTVTVANG